MCVMRQLLTLRVLFFFFKQKTAYELRISDWSSDVSSSDLVLSQPHDAISPGRKRLRSHPVADSEVRTRRSTSGSALRPGRSRSHTATLRSYDVLARSCGHVGDQRTLRTAYVWPCSSTTGVCGRRTSHTRTDLSTPPETMCVDAPDQSTVSTSLPRCPLRRSCARGARASQTLIVPSPDADANASAEWLAHDTLREG